MMIRATIGDLLDGHLDEHISARMCNIYIVRDGDLVLYVGKSNDVVGRLWSHLGKGTWGWTGISRLGQVIKANLPAARRWQIELMTGEDCLLALGKCTDYEYLTRPDGTNYLQRTHMENDSGFEYYSILTATNTEELEAELIRAYNPCLNDMGNPEPTPLPDHYQVPWNKLPSDPGGHAAAMFWMPEKKAKRKRKSRVKHNC